MRTQIHSHMHTREHVTTSGEQKICRINNLKSRQKYLSFFNAPRVVKMATLTLLQVPVGVALLLQKQVFF